MLSKNKLHENYYLDILQVTTVIKKLETKTPVVEFHQSINDYMSMENMTEYIHLLKDNLLGI